MATASFFVALTARTDVGNVSSAERYSAIKRRPDSICPSGWHLPSSTGTSSYTTLVQNYVGRGGDHNSDLPILTSPLGFTRSGDYGYDNGNLGNQSLHGYYWSHTPFSKANAYRLAFFSTYLSPRDPISRYRGLGYPLRCLVR